MALRCTLRPLSRPSSREATKVKSKTPASKNKSQPAEKSEGNKKNNDASNSSNSYFKKENNVNINKTERNGTSMKNIAFSSIFIDRKRSFKAPKCVESNTTNALKPKQCNAKPVFNTRQTNLPNGGSRMLSQKSNVTQARTCMSWTKYRTNLQPQEKKTFLNNENGVRIDKRNLNCTGDAGELVGLVTGVFTRKDDPYGLTKIYTKFAEQYDKSIGNKISDILDTTGPIPKKGQYKVMYKIDPQFSTVVVVGIGDECATYNESEQIDEMKENVRDAVALGVRVLQDLNMKTILIDSMGSAEAAAEGAALGVWRFQELKNPNKQVLIPRIEMHGDCDFTAWQIGLQKAAAQNIARQLCETPANILTPLGFSQAAVEILCKAGVSVDIKVREWAKIMKMGGFLAASNGSCEPPVFLEVSYYGCEPDVAPAVLIGKGVTFDSGGLCLKPGFRALKHMRGDMAGAACLIGTIRAAAALQLPINIKGLMPIYENLPGTCAMKPGDIITARNGKSVLINDTDYDGRLSMADALCYSQIFNPKFVLDIGTLSKELLDSLGLAACGAYSNNDSLFETLKNAAVHTGDRIWRLPLWNHFSQKVTNNPISDVQDREIESGLPCTCAAFLKEFVPQTDWIHLDTYGVAVSDGNSQMYLRKGMSGRPTRTLVEFLAQLACNVGRDEEENSSEKK